jgi:hypothetical protein
MVEFLSQPVKQCNFQTAREEKIEKETKKNQYQFTEDQKIYFF